MAIKAFGKSKQISTSNREFVAGGTTKMFRSNGVGTQTPGQTSTKPKNTGGKPAGGKGRMFTGQHASARVAGRTGK